MASKPNKLVTVLGLADRLKLPAPWLKAEAMAGRIPSLRVGRRLLFNVTAVERLLLKRAGHHRIHGPTAIAGGGIGSGDSAAVATTIARGGRGER